MSTTRTWLHELKYQPVLPLRESAHPFTPSCDPKRADICVICGQRPKNWNHLVDTALRERGRI